MRDLWLPNANALQLQHTRLRFRPSRRGETADLAAGSQNPVARDDQGHGIFSHRLADVARSFAPGADRLRQRAIGGRAPPADPTQRRINLGEERVLASKIDTDTCEVHVLAGKVSFRRFDNRRNLFGERARLGAGARRRINRSVASALFVGN